MSKLIKHKIYQRAILLLVLGVIIVAAGCVRRQQGDKEVEIGEPVTQPTLMKLYNEAQGLISAKKTTEAIAKYKEFLTQHPEGNHDYFKTRLAFTMALFNLLVQWHGLPADKDGFVPLSIGSLN